MGGIEKKYLKLCYDRYIEFCLNHYNSDIILALLPVYFLAVTFSPLCFAHIIKVTSKISWVTILGFESGTLMSPPSSPRPAIFIATLHFRCHFNENDLVVYNKTIQLCFQLFYRRLKKCQVVWLRVDTNRSTWLGKTTSTHYNLTGNCTFFNEAAGIASL